MSETWKPVVGYEGRYEVSDRGRARSVDRVIVQDYLGISVARKMKGRMLHPSLTKRGYRLATLALNQKALVHRLVLEAFVGPCPDDMEGCHNDGDGSNNSLLNLRWDTRTGNEADKLRHGRSNRGERDGQAKLTEWDARWIKRFQKHGFAKQSYLADVFKVARSTIANIKSGERWAWLEV